MTLEQRQQELAATLAGLRTSQDRLAWLVEEARKRPMLEPGLRTEANRVEGCLARLWLVAEFRDGRCHFRSESDSLIVKAVAGLLCELHSDQAPEAILAHRTSFLSDLGLTQHLTQNRRNGLGRVEEYIRAFAREHSDAALRRP